MEPGPELDAAVCAAVGIVPLAWFRCCDGFRQAYPTEEQAITAIRPGFHQWIEPAYPPVSTDLAAAWRVVEALCGKGYSYEVGSNLGGHTRARFYVIGKSHAYSDIGISVPYAICLAALKALGVDPC